MNSVEKPRSSLESEFKQFLCLKVDLSIEMNDWWFNNQNFYPQIAKFVRKYHTMQGTSCSSERIFSIGGNIVKKRTSLKPELIEIDIFKEE